MIFTEVNLLSAHSQEVIEMSFRDPTLEKSYVLKALLGLDVDEITTRYYGKNANGNQFYTMNVGPRSVVLHVAMNPNYAIGETVSSLRASIYKAISSNRTGAMTLRFVNGEETVAAISGFVQKVEIDHFSATPDLKIILNCSRDPLLRSIVDYPVSIGFSNPLQAIIEDPVSEAPHGLKMELVCTEAVPSVRFYDDEPHEWEFTITPGLIDSNDGFLENDRLFISSEDNNRHVYIIRNNEPIHLAHKIALGSVWPMMFPGTTSFSITPGFNWISMSYRTAFWGI